MGRVITVALKDPVSVWIFPPPKVPEAGAGVAEALGEGRGVGDGEGLGEGERLGLGEGKGLGEGEGVKITEGEGEDPEFLVPKKELLAAYIVRPIRITRVRIIGREIIPQLLSFWGINYHRIKIQLF